MRLPVAALAIAGLAGAEGIHVAVMADHWRLWWAEGAFFAALAVVEGALAAALATLPSRALGRVAVGVSVATIALWAWSRTVGVPAGPAAGTAEPVGRADLAATSLEALTAVVLAPVAWQWRARARALRAVAGRTMGPVTGVVAIAAVLAVTVLGLTADHRHTHRAGHQLSAPINVAGQATTR